MKTAYKPIPSPFQTTRRKSYNIQEDQHPVRISVRELCGTYNITSTFEEDKETLTTFKHIPGLIAILCTLRQDGKIIGQGRGSAVVNRVNRILERTLSVAINGAFLSAANNATKVLDTLRLETPSQVSSKSVGVAYVAPESEVSDLATDKQKSYLQQLIQLNVEDDSERDRLIMQMDELTRSEASDAIKSFAR